MIEPNVVLCLSTDLSQRFLNDHVDSMNYGNGFKLTVSISTICTCFRRINSMTVEICIFNYEF